MRGRKPPQKKFKGRLLFDSALGTAKCVAGGYTADPVIFVKKQTEARKKAVAQVRAATRP